LIYYFVLTVDVKGEKTDLSTHKIKNRQII